MTPHKENTMGQCAGKMRYSDDYVIKSQRFKIRHSTEHITKKRVRKRNDILTQNYILRDELPP